MVPSLILKWRSYVRANQWWAFKAAPILGFTYLYFYLFTFSFTDKIIIFFLSAMTILGIAGFGYFINDLCDIEPDKKAGKKNPFDGKSFLFIIQVGIVLTVLALTPWIFLRSKMVIWVLLSFQIILYLLYALPHIRLKEKSIWGPICDALYGHAVPITIACLTYEQYVGGNLPYNEQLFFAVLFIWQFFKGMRNIFLHQLEDYDNDNKAHIQTLTTEKGQDAIYKSIIRVILPLEFILMVAFLFILVPFLPWIILYLIFFFVIYILGHGLFRNTPWNAHKYTPNTYIYLLNNFYETYLPIFFLTWCIYKETEAVSILIIHLILFPSTIWMISNDLKKALIELRIQLDNFASSTLRKLKK